MGTLPPVPIRSGMLVPVQNGQRLWAWRLPPQIPFRKALLLSAHRHARLHGQRSGEWRPEIFTITGHSISSGRAWHIGALSSMESPDVAERSPGVYAISASDRMLYVGHTNTCLSRRLKNHHEICLSEERAGRGGELVLADSDIVRFYCCANLQIARRLERAMIRWFEPVYNRQWW